ncbi:MAG: T9SS type A sorting domain-containing protein [Bacteroidia bacterium]
MKKLFLLCTIFLLTLSLTMAQSGLQVAISATPSCNNDGTATATVAGGVPPYTYSWNLPAATGTASTQTVMNLPAGWVNVYVIDAGGLVGIQWGQVPPSVYLDMDSSVFAICPATTATVGVIISGGTAPFSFQWSNGATTPSITGSLGNTYSVIVTDATGCTVNSLDQWQASTVFSQTTMTVSIPTTPANCANGTATVNVTAVGNTIPPYTYSWSNGQTTQTATNLVAYQSHQVWITDAQSCVEQEWVYVSTNTFLQASGTSTSEYCDDLNGTATAYISGGTAPYTHSWNTGQTTQAIANLADGYYNVWITDANSCVGQYSVSVTENTPLNFSYNINPTACSTANGQATVTPTLGTSPYTYYWNTNPPQMTATATGLGEGTYQVTVSDAAGCDKTAFVSIPNASTISLNPYSSQPETCNQQNGVAVANASGGVAPLAYSWSNGQTTANVIGLNSGYYSVTVTDAAACQRTKWVNISHNSLISLMANTTPASCIFNADGSATANVLGSGTAPYTYYWSTGAGNVATATNLLPGYYSVSVTDAAGCTAYAWANVGNSNTQVCEVQIDGKVYFDQNQDCFHNPLVEPLLKNVWIEAQPNGGMKMTNLQGQYHFDLQPNTYTVVQYLPTWGTQTCPATNPVVTLPTAGMIQNNVDFADDFVPIQDISIYGTSLGLPPRPGFPYNQRIHLSNPGVLMANGTVTCVHDANVTFTGSNPSASSYDPLTRTITWNYTLLQGFYDAQTFDVYYQVPTTTQAGTILYFEYQANPLVGDNTIWNNQDNYLVNVVASYDPNYMEVSPKGNGAEGYINYTDSVLTYTTHFQNTGNFFATFVRLEIPLDMDLRTNSIEILAASHEPYRAEITPNNMLIIYFDNINLPDSFSNPIGSCGFVTFRLHLKEGLANGTQIINHSEIIFDYNAPVITNEVINTIKGTISVDDEANKTHFKLYPNPTQNEIQVEFGEAQAENILELYNVLGVKVKTLQAEKGIAKLTASIQDLTAGIYLYKAIVNGEQQQTGKIIKQ